MDEIKNLTLVKRFLKYVSFDTQSIDNGSNNLPSTKGQWDLAYYVAEELKSLGVDTIEVDENCFVYASINASCGLEDKPAIALFAHLDVSDEVPAKNISPQIFKGEGKFLSKHIIKSDGTTLLGGDDKAGMAEIVTLAEVLLKDKDIKHPKINIVFTPDEEICRGVYSINLDKIDAKVGYTLDGTTVGEVTYTNFNAASATVEFRGVVCHPGNSYNIAKNPNVMLADFISHLPNARPETTKGNQGYVSVCESKANTNYACADLILRSFSKEELQSWKSKIAEVCSYINKKYNPATCSFSIKDTYNNMHDIIIPKYRFLAENAISAFKEAGITPLEIPIRGGCDASILAEKGLYCINLGTGVYMYHSLDEFVCIEEMQQTVDALVNLLQKNFDVYVK